MREGKFIVAIIDELRKAYEEDRNNRKWENESIKEIIFDLSERVRIGLIANDKIVEYKYDTSTSDEDSAKYYVEKLKEKIEKEFRPQKLEVSYKRIAKSFFVDETYYIVYLRVSIKL